MMITPLPLLLIAGTIGASKPASAATSVFRIASPSIVTVHAKDSAGLVTSFGSGVVISDGVVVSNCHVTSNAARVEVGHEGRRLAAKTRHMDVERDLCSFSVSGLGAQSVSIGSTSNLEVGQAVFALGSPQGLELSLSSGILSSLRTVNGGRLIQTTAAISPGSSGGGLFDESGRLIGITTLYLKDSQQLNFAVPVEWVSEMPSRHSVNVSMAERLAAAKSAVNALEAELRQENAATYDRLKEELVAAIPEVKETYAPEEWADALRAHYRILVARDQVETRQYTLQVDEARRLLTELGKQLHAADPSTYLAVQAQLATAVKRIASTSPPEDWVRLTRDEYAELATRHRANARWVVLSASNDAVARIDKKTLSRKGKKVTAWVEVIYSTPRNVADLEGVGRYIVQQEFACYSNTFANLEATYYAASGAVLESETYSDLSEAMEFSITPGTIAESAFEYACAR